MGNLACERVKTFISKVLQSFYKGCSSLISGEIICAICTQQALGSPDKVANKNSNSSKWK